MCERSLSRTLDLRIQMEMIDIKTTHLSILLND